MSDHIHGPWVHAKPVIPRYADGYRPRNGPLVCVGCGTDWPGEPLPEPYLKLNAGYGDLADITPWRRRVKHMVNALDEPDVLTA
jgi:hypothetical protein